MRVFDDRGDEMVFVPVRTAAMLLPLLRASVIEGQRRDGVTAHPLVVEAMAEFERVVREKRVANIADQGIARDEHGFEGSGDMLSVMSVAQVSGELEVSPQHVRRWLRAGLLYGRPSPAGWQIYRHDFNEFVSQRNERKAYDSR